MPADWAGGGEQTHGGLTLLATDSNTAKPCADRLTAGVVVTITAPTAVSGRFSCYDPGKPNDGTVMGTYVSQAPKVEMLVADATADTPTHNVESDDCTDRARLPKNVRSGMGLVSTPTVRTSAGRCVVVSLRNAVALFRWRPCNGTLPHRNPVIPCKPGSPFH